MAFHFSSFEMFSSELCQSNQVGKGNVRCSLQNPKFRVESKTEKCQLLALICVNYLRQLFASLNLACCKHSVANHLARDWEQNWETWKSFKKFINFYFVLKSETKKFLDDRVITNFLRLHNVRFNWQHIIKFTIFSFTDLKVLNYFE